MVNNINNAYQSQAAYNQVRTPKPESGEVSKTETVSKVEELKQRINDGTYKVDFDKTAKAIAETLV